MGGKQIRSPGVEQKIGNPAVSRFMIENLDRRLREEGFQRRGSLLCGSGLHVGPAKHTRKEQDS
jgi:hypothetical protein